MQIGLVVTFPSYYVNGLPQPSFISIDEANFSKLLNCYKLKFTGPNPIFPIFIIIRIKI